MSSTNKTTNYNLSQFLGSDKPAWLADYNQDMSKIDTQMKANADSASGADGKADANTANIGDLTYLSTSTKNNLVAAINEVDGNTDTAQSTANTASTTANQALNICNLLNDYLNIGASNTEITSSNMQLTGTGTIRSNSKIHIVGNADKSLIKIYGEIMINDVTPSASITVTVNNTGLTPSSNLTINSCGIITKETSSQVVFIDPLTYNINNNGTITFTIQNTANTSIVGAKFLACLVFVKNFGD